MNNISSSVAEIMDRHAQESPEYIFCDPADRKKSRGYFSQYAEYADNDQVIVPDNPSPNEIRVDRAEDLGPVFEAFFKYCTGKYRWDVDVDSYIASVIDHESQHGQIAQELGHRAVRYGIRFEQTYSQRVLHYPGKWVRSRSYTTTSPFTKVGEGDLELPKIEFAALLAFPEQPSDGDKFIFNQLGYKNVQEIYDRSKKIKNFPTIQPLSLE